MIKCIVCDLDGTLICKDDSMESAMLQCLRKQLDRGVELILATGRSYHMVEEILQHYQLHCDLILNNGAEYRNAQNDIMSLIPMEQEAFVQIVRILNHQGYLLAIHTDHGLYSCHDKDAFWDYHIKLLTRNLPEKEQLPQKTFTIKEKYLKDFHYIQDPQDIYKQQVKPLKIDARHLDAQLTWGIKEKLQSLHLDISSSFEDNMEITSNHSNKGKLLEKVIATKGYAKDEVAVFGDGENDCEMLSLYPYSFAPQNAVKKAKEVANYTLTTTNEQGAVKEGIEILESLGLL